jgi:hypothetical protein
MERILTKHQKFYFESSNPTEAVRKLAFLGPSPVLQNENSAEYDELLSHLLGDLKPIDVVEAIWIRDVADLTWEVRRWRRMKICVVEAAMAAAMVYVLAAPSHRRLAEIGAIKNVENANFGPLSKEAPISGTPRTVTSSDKRSRSHTRFAKKLAADPTALNQFLAKIKLVDDTVITRAFLEELDHIERIDRLMMNAEGRRNAALREIDRRRSNFGRTMRAAVLADEEAGAIMIESDGTPNKKTG